MTSPCPAPARQPGAARDLDASFDAEVRSATRYETGLAWKALLALAVVAILVTIRLLGF
jgi:hypothetical protein